MPLFGKKKDKSSGALKNYEKTINEGMEASRRGDSEKAVVNFRKALRWVTEDIDKVTKLSDKDKKKLSELLTDAGEEMIKLKEYDAAIKLLEKAKTINPENFRAWMDIGKDLLQRNTQVPYALVCLREASKLDPENIEVYLLLGDAYRIQGQHDKALAAYQKALKVDPENVDALQKVLKIQPENVEILERYIKALEKGGDSEELLKAYNRMVSITGAPEYLERGLQLDPDNKDLLMNKARLLLKEEKVDEANEIVKKLKEEYPDDVDISMLYDELNPKEVPEGEGEAVKAIEVGELFGDISLGESASGEFEEGTMGIEGSEAAEAAEAVGTGKVAETPKEEKEELEEREEPSEKGTAPVAGEVVGEESVTPGIAEEEKPVTQESGLSEETLEVEKPEMERELKTQTPETPAPQEEKIEAMFEAPPEPEKKEMVIPPEYMFLQLYGERKRDDARRILEGMVDEDVLKLISENADILKFIYHSLVNSGRNDLALKFIDAILDKDDSEENRVEKARLLIEMNNLSDAEALLNDIVKKNMKNGNALYLKARIMSIKGNDMGARNFLMMALKFNPELKEKAKTDEHLQKYRDKDWFKKIVS